MHVVVVVIIIIFIASVVVVVVIRWSWWAVKLKKFSHFLTTSKAG